MNQYINIYQSTCYHKHLYVCFSDECAHFCHLWTNITGLSWLFVSNLQLWPLVNWTTPTLVKSCWCHSRVGDWCDVLVTDKNETKSQWLCCKMWPHFKTGFTSGCSLGLCHKWFSLLLWGSNSENDMQHICLYVKIDQC